MLWSIEISLCIEAFVVIWACRILDFLCYILLELKYCTGFVLILYYYIVFTIKRKHRLPTTNDVYDVY